MDVTADGVNWVSLENTMTSAAAWNQYSFDLADYIPFTGHMQVRFIAADEINGSLVEAAVDDIMFDVTRGSSAGIDPEGASGIRTSGLVSLSPNPFNPAVTVVYGVSEKAPVEMKVYDVAGRMVRSLVSGVVAAGEHTVVFDGRNSAGESLASGVYFLRFDTPEVTQVRQLVLLK